MKNEYDSALMSLVKNVDLYSEDNDLRCMSMNKKYIKMNGSKPKYVELNGKPILYSTAYQLAVNEITDLFDNCNTYKEARNIILNLPGVFSNDNGYNVTDECTGNYYGVMVLLYGSDKDEKIYWDVRWY